MWLTAWAGVAVCDGIQRCCGVRPGIKWTNDLILSGRKVCGILTELGMEGESAWPQYVVLGVGVNVQQTEADFGPQVAPVAVSLRQVLGSAPRRADLAASILLALDEMRAAFPGGSARYLEQYRRDCVTLGREVRLMGPEGGAHGGGRGH